MNSLTSKVAIHMIRVVEVELSRSDWQLFDGTPERTVHSLNRLASETLSMFSGTVLATDYFEAEVDSSEALTEAGAGDTEPRAVFARLCRLVYGANHDPSPSVMIGRK